MRRVQHVEKGCARASYIPLVAGTTPSTMTFHLLWNRSLAERFTRALASLMPPALLLLHLRVFV